MAKECLTCPNLRDVTRDDRGRPRAVGCASAQLSTQERAEAGPLSLPKPTVAELMTRNVVCMRPELTLDAAVVAFLENEVMAAPVVDTHGSLLGFVSQTDVMLDVQARGHPREGGASRGESSVRTVGDVMEPFAVALPEHTSITRAAGVMAFEGSTRIAVVSSHGTVVGVLSARDILYWLARCDGYVLPRRRLER